MKIEKAPPKEPQPVSFRISIETHFRLKALGELTNKSQGELLEDWVEQAYAEAEKKFPKDLLRAEARIRAAGRRGRK